MHYPPQFCNFDEWENLMWTMYNLYRRLMRLWAIFCVWKSG